MDMGQSSNAEETQGTNEGSTAPLPRNPTLTAWAPVLRKTLAIALGGVGLACIGALSMARTSLGGSDASSSATANFAHLAPGAEWLAAAASAETVEATPSAQQCPPAPPCTPAGPSGGDPTNGETLESASHTARTGSGILADGRVVLNVASADELTTLPGIGQKRAEAIVALRTRLRGFRKVADLLRVKGIGVKSLRKLEPKLVLEPPAAAP